MVWFALGYALTGTLIASKVGFPLIGLNADRYAREAELRLDLVRINESAESIAIYGGEADERRQIAGSFGGVILAMRRLCNALTRLTWITSGYGWIAIVAPIAAASPGYFSGGLTLGGLMMVVGAFNQVQQSLRWFVDNLAVIADWRATLHRVSAFRASLLLLDQVDREIEHIERHDHPEGRLVLDRAGVLLSDGHVAVDDERVEIRTGERVHLVGGTATGASTLFRAIAGLWPWGSGSIWTPGPKTMMFLPQRPYLPRGSLCAAICYPLPPAAFEQAHIEAALTRVGLADLVPMLYREERLDKRLSLGRQQLIAFARLLLHLPSWVFLDNATSALDETNERLALSVLTQELAASAVLSIGHSPGLAALKGRTLTLVHAAGGRLLRQTLRLQPAGRWAWVPS
jgi:putative ATP-binding cassette transporter